MPDPLFSIDLSPRTYKPTRSWSVSLQSLHACRQITDLSFLLHMHTCLMFILTFSCLYLSYVIFLTIRRIHMPAHTHIDLFILSTGMLYSKLSLHRPHIQMFIIGFLLLLPKWITACSLSCMNECYFIIYIVIIPHHHTY